MNTLDSLDVTSRFTTGFTPHQRWARSGEYDHADRSAGSFSRYSWPFAWRATVRTERGPAVAVRTARVGLGSLLIGLPYPVAEGDAVAIGLDMPRGTIYASTTTLDLETTVEFCVLRGTDGFFAQLCVESFANPRQQQALESFLRSRQSSMIFAPM